MEKEMKECPLCNSGRTEKIYDITVDEVYSRIDSRNPKVLKEIKKIWDGTRCEFMKCNDCSFSFASPFRGGTKKLYSLIYKDNYPTDRWEYGLALDEVSKEDVCLEIGGGKGWFIGKLKDYCDGEEVFSVEVSDDINNLPKNKKFSKVFMFQVLEHLDNFKEILDKISEITSDDAKLIVSVPHESSVEFFRKKGVISDNPPIHVSRWNKRTIGLLKGWEISDYKVDYLSYYRVFKCLFYGIRTIEYPKTRNIFLLFDCFLRALTKMSFRRMIESQYFCLVKAGRKDEYSKYKR